MAVDLYRNRDFIPNFDEIAAETAARSRDLAAKVQIQRDISYGPSNRECFDLVFPSRPVKGAPLHIFFHGGYWRSGSKEDHLLVAAPVLAVGGIAAIVTYDLMPGTRLGTIVKQTRAAVRKLGGMAASIGADPTRLTASGHSAGAHLASYLAAVSHGETEPESLPSLRALLLVSGLYDLKDIPNSFLKNETQMTADEAKTWSPLVARQLQNPKRIIMVSENDSPPFHEQGRTFTEHLQQIGAQATLRTEKGLNHMSIVLALGDPQSAVGQCLAEVVLSDERTSPPGP